MAKRIGKYKVSNKESALSAIDGGAIAGNISVSGTTTLTGVLSAASTVKFTNISASSDPGVAGQLFVTTSMAAASTPLSDITGSADIVLISRG